MDRCSLVFLYRSFKRADIILKFFKISFFLLQKHHFVCFLLFLFLDQGFLVIFNFLLFIDFSLLFGLDVLFSVNLAKGLEAFGGRFDISTVRSDLTAVKIVSLSIKGQLFLVRTGFISKHKVDILKKLVLVYLFKVCMGAA